MILAQAAHSLEEYVGRLWESFPPARFLSGLVSADLERGFIVINVLVVAFGVWCFAWPVRRAWPSAAAFAWAWVAVELINGIGHPLWSLRVGGYTPGVATAVVLLVLAAYLARLLLARDADGHETAVVLTPATRRRPPVWALVSAAWLGPAILAAFQVYVQGRIGNREPATWREILWEGGDWLLYALLTPAVFWLARRFPLARGTIARHLPVHVLGAVLLCAAWAGGGVLLSWAMFRSTPYGGGAVGWFFTSLPFGVAVYFAVLGVEHAAFYFVEARERETHAARLSAQLAEARLGALRMQMQPHFLLNSLNAITVIVRDRDTVTATRMLEQLGDMLRRVTRADRPPEVTLAEELDFVRQYLAIEEVRFSDRLRPVFAVDPSLLAAAVPEFVLQPLVENALRHGLARRVGATRLEIAARREGNELVLSVTDDGPGPDDAAREPMEGVGLGNTRERLATLYGDRASLTLARRRSGGATATVRLPYRELEAEGG